MKTIYLKVEVPDDYDGDPLIAYWSKPEGSKMSRALKYCKAKEITMPDEEAINKGCDKLSYISSDDFKKEATEIIKSLIEEFDNGEVSWELRDKADNLGRFITGKKQKN